MNRSFSEPPCSTFLNLSIRIHFSFLKRLYLSARFMVHSLSVWYASKVLRDLSSIGLKSDVMRGCRLGRGRYQILFSPAPFQGKAEERRNGGQVLNSSSTERSFVS